MALSFKPPRPALPKPKELPALGDQLTYAFYNNGYPPEEARKYAGICELLGIGFDTLMSWSNGKPEHRKLQFPVLAEFNNFVQALHRKEAHPEFSELQMQLGRIDDERYRPFRERMEKNPELKQVIEYFLGAWRDGSDEWATIILPAMFIEKARDTREFVAIARAAYEATKGLPEKDDIPLYYREYVLTRTTEKSKNLDDFNAWNDYAREAVLDCSARVKDADAADLVRGATLVTLLVAVSKTPEIFKERFAAAKPIVFRDISAKTVDYRQYFQYAAPFIAAVAENAEELKSLDDAVRAALARCEEVHGDASWYLPCLPGVLSAIRSVDGFTRTQEAIFRNKIRDERWLAFLTHALDRKKIGDNGELSHILRELKTISEHLPDAHKQDGFLFKHEWKNKCLPYVEDALLSFSGLDEETVRKLGNALSIETTRVKVNKYLRGVSYAAAHPEARETVAELVRNESRSRLPGSLEMLPFLAGCDQRKILNQEQIHEIARSGDTVNRAAAVLSGKFQAVYSCLPSSPESVRAVTDNAFVLDVLGFYTSYSKAPATKKILVDLVRAYFMEGSDGVKKMKFGESRDPRVTPEIRQALAGLDTLRVRQIPDREKPLDRFETILNEYRDHAGELTAIPDITAALNARLEEVCSGCLSAELAQAISGGNMKALMALKLGSADAKRRGVAIEILKARDAKEDLEFGQKIAAELLRIREMPEEKHAEEVARLRSKHALGCINAFDNLGALKSHVDRFGKEDAGEALANLRAMLKEITESAKNGMDGALEARISFDLAHLMKLGRYGASGQGNCQQWVNEGDLNQSLMGFIGNPTELQIVPTDGTNGMVGFRQIHGCFIGTAFSLILEKNIYSRSGAFEGTIRKASLEHAKQIRDKTGWQVYLVEPKGVPTKVRVPDAPLKCYWDCCGKSPEPGTEITLNLAPL